MIAIGSAVSFPQRETGHLLLKLRQLPFQFRLPCTVLKLDCQQNPHVEGMLLLFQGVQRLPPVFRGGSLSEIHSILLFSDCCHYSPAA